MKKKMAIGGGIKDSTGKGRYKSKSNIKGKVGTPGMYAGSGNKAMREKADSIKRTKESFAKYDTATSKKPVSSKIPTAPKFMKKGGMTKKK